MCVHYTFCYIYGLIYYCVKMSGDIHQGPNEEATIQRQDIGGKELITVAVDIGTAFSGFAFLSRKDFKINPLKVQCKIWPVGELGTLVKDKSIILLNNEKKYVAFGYEAEKMYNEMGIDQAKEHYYFAYFKMSLYKSKSLRKNMRLTDAMGRQLRGRVVFSESIRYLKNQAMMLLEKSSVYKEEDVKWILTLPAIWSESAKQFMIWCCTEAGIRTDRLKIALEPESAALFCHYQELDRYERDGQVSVQTFRSDTKFLVLDLGGGTVDITAYIVKKGSTLNTLHEIYRASGGACGGRKVDEAFEEFWRSVLSSETWEELKTEYRDEINEFFTMFELKKRSYKDRENVILILPECIKEIENISELLNNYSDMPLQIKRGKITFPQKLFLSFFDNSLKQLTKILENLLNQEELSGVHAMLMVGGYSESSVVQNAIKQVVDKRPAVKIIIPTEAGSAVVKGACIYGFAPDIIIERVSRHTYGVSTRINFDETRHSRNSIHCDGHYIENVFHKFVCAGDTIPIGHTVTYSFYARPSNSEIELFASTAKNPIYTWDPNMDEDSTFRIGEVKFPNFAENDIGRKVEVSMVFGDTHLIVFAMFSSGERIESKLTLLK